VTFTLKIDASKAKAGLAKAESRLTSHDLKLRMGKSVSELVRRHLRTRNTTHRNKLGGRRTNFWARASEAVNFEATPDGALVSVSQEGVLQQYRGGIIRPVNAKALTIPVHPKAHGKSAGEFKDLVYVKQKPGRRSLGLLISRPKGKQLGEVFFVLLRSVRQKPDPTVLPTEAEIKETVSNTVLRFLTT